MSADGTLQHPLLFCMAQFTAAAAAVTAAVIPVFQLLAGDTGECLILRPGFPEYPCADHGKLLCCRCIQLRPVQRQEICRIINGKQVYSVFRHGRRIGAKVAELWIGQTGFFAGFPMVLHRRQNASLVIKQQEAVRLRHSRPIFVMICMWINILNHF